MSRPLAQGPAPERPRFVIRRYGIDFEEFGRPWAVRDRRSFLGALLVRSFATHAEALAWIDDRLKGEHLDRLAKGIPFESVFAKHVREMTPPPPMLLFHTPLMGEHPEEPTA